MKDIEVLSKGLFERFASLKGERANWLYLSDERKLEWMREAIIHTEYVIKDIRSKIKPVPVPSKGEASYALGFLNGMYSKQLEFLGFLEYIDKNLKQQFESIINPSED